MNMKYKYEVESKTIEMIRLFTHFSAAFGFLYERLWVQICKDITYFGVSTNLHYDGQVQTVWKSVLEQKFFSLY